MALHRSKAVIPLGAVTVMALVVGLVGYVGAFHRMPWQTIPSELHVCGRDYINPDPSHPYTEEGAERFLGGPLRQVGTTSGWLRARPVLAVSGGSTGSGPAGFCGTLVAVRQGDDHLVVYELSGGP